MLALFEVAELKHYVRVKQQQKESEQRLKKGIVWKLD